MKKLHLILFGTLWLVACMTPAVASLNHLSTVSEQKKAKKRFIKKVEPIVVECPQGTNPRLPWQVWLTYSDGTGEWRQTRWSNSTQQTEQMEQTYLVGHQFTVDGVITGDNTTENGYPITASVKVVNKKWNAPLRPVAEPLPLTMVTITGDNRLTWNRNLDIREILSWDITQQLYNYRDTYGLSTEGYKVADGWDSPTTKLKGHGSGHYMSALAFAYASTYGTADGRQIRERIERMVNELRECQERTFVWSDSLGRYFEARDYAPEPILKEMKGTWAAFNEYKKDYKHYGYGYLNAIPAAHPELIECYRAYHNEEWVWAPYYTIHKQLAGLLDIANVMNSITTSLNDVQPRQNQGRRLTNKQIAEKALLIAKDMGLWVWNRLHYRTYVSTEGDKAQRQARPGNRYEMWNMYIAGEVGGMQESLARLSEMVTDPTEKARLLEAANCFDSPAFYQPLSTNMDDIRTRHANQHIPMITGALRSYRGNNNPYYYHIAYNFWNMIQGRYAYAMGGVGNGEMFRQPYSQMLSMNTSVSRGWGRNGGTVPDPNINETCCAYNLAKLTKDLNCFDPDDARYMDYYERVLYNQIIGSLNPDHYSCTYQYAVGMNAQKPFGNETPQSTCCGGTGAENHVKYQEAAYFVNEAAIWVALYMPTVAQWAQKDVVIEQECQWPAESSKIKIKKGNATFAMKLRVPYWATKGFNVTLNGKSLGKKYQPCSYFEIPARQWKEGDVVEVTMPFTTHINWGPDKMELAATTSNPQQPFTPMWVGAVMYGPLVMTTEAVKTWDDADFTLSSDLSELQPQPVQAGTGKDANLYTLKLSPSEKQGEGLLFVPDYYETHRSTHYLRLNVLADQSKGGKSGLKLSKATLESAIKIANARKTEQEKWNALTVKVPAHAPWAPHGYARLMEQLTNAEAVLAKSDASQTEISSATSLLNMVINTMRPGNLAEPEDLTELQNLLTECKDIRDKTTELREAISYADMVVGYVNGGSGTKDMIVKALDRLKTARANNK